jgi:hypothetical protein
MNQLDEMQKLISLMENSLAHDTPALGEGDEQERIYDALDELQNIAEQLFDLSDHAKQIMQQYFPAEARQADAYGALDFGGSRNQYDTTFMAILDDLLSEYHN